MNLQQAMQEALKYEHKVRDHYAKGCEAITDPQGKKVFETLAKEEQGHVDFLEHNLAKLKEHGHVDEAPLKSVLPPGTDWIAKERKKLTRKPTKRVAQGNEIELLKLALQLEVKTSTFYKKLVSDLSEEDRPFFERFLAIEEGHVAIVQAELDSVQGLGYWFDVAEFRLEAG